MVKVAHEPELKKAFTMRREETQGQIERLEKVFDRQAAANQALRGD
jgi:ferritin-like metal-binding protein YciE